jgi:hypothetical protein
MKRSSSSKWVCASLWLGAVCLLVVSTDGFAAGGRRGPDPNKQPDIENPFHGEVVTATATTVTVKGDRKGDPDPKNPNDTAGKLNIRFSIRPDVAITRDNQKIAATDIKKGEMALVSFTMKEGSTMRRVTDIKVGNVSAAKGDQQKGASDKPKDSGKGKKNKAGDKDNK